MAAVTAPRWVVHLPTTLTSREAAAGLAAVLRQSLAHVEAIDFAETTLSEEDAQHLRHRVWCDTRLDGGRRCGLGHRHPGRCGTTP
ncbi:hypothetical protein K7640_10815 [Micromonospora sp. PLK6-60]|uniref:hypothetical protein n=1 Tax=Micromonospora sp. PLK6-60 TaxID=2873383 RepID=UPI001CA78D29|nr:hypothetical protein [Micromonospora sp. PLK6-60]MBY8872330.1 hypothetical protein [Micromonospora sp. PLK6-60]